MAAVVPLGANDSIAGTLDSPGAVDEFQVSLPDNGRLTATVHTGSALNTRLTLLGPDGQLLIQSDGQSPTDPDDLIVQHLLAGTYVLKLAGLAGGTGNYTLSTEFEPATPPNQSVFADYPTNYPFALSPRFGAVGDFNGDGRLDVVTANTNTGDVSLLLGLGDGTFQTARNFPVGVQPLGIAVGDFNGDGKLDVAVANSGSGDVSILLGRGDGTFAPERRVPGVDGGSFMATADLNGDGKLDLVIGSLSSNDVSVLLGNGDGTFQPEVLYATGGKAPARLALGDFNGDGYPDIAAANFASNRLSILLGRGDGTFEIETGNPTTGAPLSAPFGIVAGDFNHDGRLDLAVTNSDNGSNNVSLFLGNGDGTFHSAGHPLATGSAPFMVVAGDFNGDGNLDLASTNFASDDISVLLGKGDGTFQDQRRYRAGVHPWGIMAADFDGDGRLDLASINAQSHDVSILLGLGDGTFQPDLTDPRHGGTNPLGIVAADFNRDGIADLAVVSYAGHDLFVFRGRGDGTFGEPVAYPVGSTPAQIVAADFNGDGILDLATANCNSGDVSVLLGRGDGTFQPEQRFAASTSGEFIMTADFNGDGKLDLITGGQFGAGIAVLLGNGDGTFQPPRIFALGYAVAGVAVGDFNGDGNLDLAVTNIFSPEHDVLIFLGNGDGTFQDVPLHIPVGIGPLGLVASDFNGDGKMDLAVTNFGIATKKADQGADGQGAAGTFAPGSVSILLGNGDGTFLTSDPLVTGPGPDSIVADDFNGDGKLDLAVDNSLGTDLSVFLGRRDGSFQTGLSVSVGEVPTPRRGLITGDFNGDGKTDLAATEVFANDVSVLLGTGDGTFQSPLRFGVGLGPVALTTGDFNSDGRLDVAGVNPTNSDVSLALGRGDTTLENPAGFPVGSGPVAVVRGDFNRDGRLDVATADFASNDVSVLLGLGDGTFRPGLRIPVGTNPTALVSADFNGDGIPDLAVADAGSNDLTILLGRGDGTFQGAVRLAAGDLPQALVTADFNGDGIPDLAVANYRSQDVWVYLDRGDGTFQAPLRFPLAESPVGLVAGDFNGDGHLDLATADYRSGHVAILLGGGDGTFAAPVRYDAGTNPVYLVMADFNGDGHLDLTAADSTSSGAYLLLGRGDGTFAAPLRRELGDAPGALLAEDFNSDGRTDLALTGAFSGSVSVLQGMGDSTFIPGGALSNPLHATPLIGDWNRDGLPDVAVVSRDGEILLRLSRSGSPGVFDAPVIVNPAPLPAARDLAEVSTRHGQLLAALDARSPSLSFYARRPDGTFAWSAGPKIPGLLPAALAAGDLTGDGLSDLVVADASGNVYVYLQNAAGGFGPTPDYSLEVGLSPSAVQLVDVDGDGRLDIVVANRYSGDVSVLCNDPHAPFAAALRFRAGTGLYSVNSPTGSLAVASRQAPAGLVAGRFDSRDPMDLVVTDSGANRFSLLRGDEAGGFLNPKSPPAFATGPDPTAVIAGRFTPGPNLDLAVLDQASGDISIFLGDGQGGFTRTFTVNAGNLPTGLAVADLNGDGQLDLLVGNDYGDLLILLGNGDGTFQPYQRADRNVALAVADLTGTGQDAFIFADQERDRVVVQYPHPGQRFVQGRQDGLLAPSAVRVADLNGDGIPDLAIANGGGNNVLVYLGTGNGQFGPANSFFTGTNPAGITISDLNHDGIPDLVIANQGSNDVSVLLGQGQGADWTLTPGPRLRAGSGPVATVVRDVTGDGIPDIVVSNSQSNRVSVLPGVGGGFFNDQTPRTFATGETPGPIFVGNFDGSSGLDLVTLNAGSNNLTFFSDFMSPSSVGHSISFGGNQPVAGVMADVNGDGMSDLLVASNGNGLISLLLGGINGPSLADTFSRPDVMHPSDLALLNADDRLNVYVTQEGQESAFLLTSFGIAVPSSASLAEVPPPADVFLVGGPGFAAAQSLLASETSPRVEPDQAGGVPLEGSVHALVATLLLAGGDDPAASDGAAAVDLRATSRLNRFLLGLENQTPTPPATVEGDPAEDPPPAGKAPSPVSEVFRQGLPDRQRQEWLNQVAEAVAPTGFVGGGAVSGEWSESAMPTSSPGPTPQSLPLAPASHVTMPVPAALRRGAGSADDTGGRAAGPCAATRGVGGKEANPPVVEFREESLPWFKPWAGAVLLAGVHKSRFTQRGTTFPSAPKKPAPRAARLGGHILQRDSAPESGPNRFSLRARFLSSARL